MNAPHDPLTLPDDLPVPQDDGACDHLLGLRVPQLRLPSTGGKQIDLHAQSWERWLVLFCYPRTGHPGVEPPGGSAAWNSTPGARGCTPQCLAYSDLSAEFGALGATVYGLSTQSTQDQREAVGRLRLPYELLSDSALQLAQALALPLFTASGLTLLRRHTLVLRDGTIRHVRYPVFPPDKDAEAILSWLSGQTR